ncbi:MAG: 1,6-anhydro-N-acetylmuramyl-L-alanine amidase AmpD [Gammaproteobacteria bacterium]|nr:1,6-anhydro-N-acetylmuramyl-L-alanine amidase AmpD [Gammaproteobacteria bacterium]MBU2676327.1 1,6-anhydro-N-acetylmuramyl-L-alanine amidase AmpD [Gammaproteobacteria bacterium]NNC56120.1 1,6-anhydro-N-acetylmuramyl-L-alanine amidase AmpD [Woeseiaceae bacterium]NNL50061.1 1,6-anhydro-N-acetylmuramyl-L-alanine amidase AmpD [Woeseiaceae bacterium]
MQAHFTVSTKTGLIEPAAQCPSPNRDARPGGEQPRLVVIHGISLPPGKFGGPEIEALFTNSLDFDAHPYFGEIRGLEVSAHLLIRRDGTVTQFVPFTERAWHAGESCFRGQDRCNDYSIGIELEGEDETAYDDRQYATLPKVLRAIFDAYPGLTAREVAGHCDIAPGRKIDPGPAFDWLRLYDGLSAS